MENKIALPSLSFQNVVYSNVYLDVKKPFFMQTEPLEAKIEFSVSKKPLWVSDESFIFPLKVRAAVLDSNSNEVIFEVSAEVQGVFIFNSVESFNAYPKEVEAHCVSALYPHCQSVIDNLTAHSGYSALKLPLVWSGDVGTLT